MSGVARMKCDERDDSSLGSINAKVMLVIITIIAKVAVGLVGRRKKHIHIRQGPRVWIDGVMADYS
jgi:hypothetical protein